MKLKIDQKKRGMNMTQNAQLKEKLDLVRETLKTAQQYDPAVNVLM